MCWKGSSNIDAGFLIDLGALNKINILHERQTVELGPGATWINVLLWNRIILRQPEAALALSELVASFWAVSCCNHQAAWYTTDIHG